MNHPQPPKVRPRPGPPVHAPAPVSATAMAFGRVAQDGTVFVRTGEEERAVGSYPGATSAEALTYFVRKYEELCAQVALFEQRIHSAELPLSEIDSTLRKLRDSTREPAAVGDLAELSARVDALEPIAAARREAAEQARIAAREEAAQRRLGLVVEAEKIAVIAPEKTQWRPEGARMKELFDLWKAEQKGPIESGKAGAKLDRRTEDDLWKRFSAARSTFDRKRRQHFALLDEQHEQARTEKHKLLAEAQALASSTDWAATAPAFKRLMDRWKGAGRASRKDDEALWQKFKEAQDTFFTARNAANAQQEAEFSDNLGQKLALLDQAEALLPITDLTTAKTRLRAIQDRWDSIGKVPRAEVERVERRLRAVEQSVRGHDESRWAASNPEARARAQSTVDQLLAGLTQLRTQRERAHENGNLSKVTELDRTIEAREQWLEQAERALADFSG